MIIDATDLLLGRLGTHVAKHALLGEKINIVNCEKSVVSGTKERVFAKYHQALQRGTPASGPFPRRQPERFVKRMIRGMLPYKKERGQIAFDNIMCYRGIPAELEGKKFDTIKEAHVDKMPNLKFVSVLDICKQIGGK